MHFCYSCGLGLLSIQPPPHPWTMYMPLILVNTWLGQKSTKKRKLKAGKNEKNLGIGGGGAGEPGLGTGRTGLSLSMGHGSHALVGKPCIHCMHSPPQDQHQEKVGVVGK